MQVFAVRANLDRVVLLVYRLSPTAIAEFLPPGIVPRKVLGAATGGILVARRHSIGTRILSRKTDGVYFAVHYVDVIKTSARSSRYSVFIVRRDTSSRFNTWLDRWTPQFGPHHASFQFREDGPVIDLDALSDDHEMKLRFRGQLAPRLPSSSLFTSIAQACNLLQDGLVRLEVISSRQIDSPSRPGREERTAIKHARFDSAFWLRNVEYLWQDKKQFCCDVAPA